MTNVREPKKANSIEKKNRIIEAGLKLFGEKGFFNITTVDIAKTAGVSTGIVYSYFTDKKDILMQSIHLYFQKIFSPLEKELNKKQSTNDVKKLIKNFINITIASHKDNYLSHEEMIAMSHLDSDIHETFMKEERTITEKIKQYLISLGIVATNINEKVHLAYNIIEDFCHESVYHKHDFIDYDTLLDETIDILYKLFK